MKFIAKYGIGIYLIISLLFKLHFIIPHGLVNVLYQTLMALGGLLFFVFYNQLMQSKNLKAFKLLYFIVFFNVLYLLVFNFNTTSLLYIIAKFSCANLIAFGIIFNYHFYKNVFTKYFKYIIAVVLFLGYTFAGIVENTSELQRLSMGFNPNDIGLLGALGVLSVLMFNPNIYKNKIDIILLLGFMLLTLLSGSKAALLNLAIGFIFIYGFTPKILGIAFSFFLVFLITPQLGYTTGIERLLSNEGSFSTRDKVFEIGLQTLNDSYFVGHGIDKYAWTNPKYWPSTEDALGPHNTYLSIGIMYGAINGTLFILMLLAVLVKALISYFKIRDEFVRFCALIILLTFVNGFFESLIVGINEFITVLFWFAVGVLGYYKLNYKKC